MTRNEPRPWFISNSVHTKTIPKNLQGDGVENKFDASQAWFSMRDEKNALNLLLLLGSSQEQEKNLLFSKTKEIRV